MTEITTSWYWVSDRVECLGETQAAFIDIFCDLARLDVFGVHHFSCISRRHVQVDISRQAQFGAILPWQELSNE